MSSLCKLTVQGVRSFNPDEQQKIEFYPLTLILGPNGAGKTTLIECLRYITTGETPPNSQKGKLWIYDPKLYKAPTVRGQVKLSFMDASKAEYTATRSIELQQIRGAHNKASVRCRTLDAVIKRPNGTSANAKCVDIDQEMLGFLGVSKAVLTNVIFCHQEDSNWPLSEGKVLKDKFDAIFGSQVYVKALKKVKDLRKEHGHKLELKKQELRLCEEQKEIAEKYEKELADNKISLTSYKSGIADIDKELGPQEAKVRNIEEQERKYGAFESKLANMRGKLEEQRKTYTEMKKSIKESFPGSMAELTDALANFQSEIEEKEKFQRKLETKIKALEGELNKSSTILSSCLVEKGKLESKKQDHDRAVASRESVLKAFEAHAEKLMVQLPTESLTEMANSQVAKFFEEQISDLRRQSEETTSSSEKKIQQLQKTLENLRMTKSNLEHSRKSYKESLLKKQSEQEALEDRLRQISFSNSKLQRLRSERDEKKNELEEMQTNFKKTEVNEKLKELQKNKADIKLEIENLNIELTRLHAESTIRTEYSLQEKAKTKEEENMMEILERNRTVMGGLYIDGDSSFYMKLSEKIKGLEKKEEEIKKQIQAAEVSKANSETHLNLELERRSTLSKELDECTQKVKQVCRSKSYEDMYSAVEEKLKRLRKTYTSAESCRAVWEEIGEGLKKTQKCPVCLHGLNGDDEREGAMKNINSRIRNLPQEKDAIATELKSCELLFEKLVDLKAVQGRLGAIPTALQSCRTAIDAHKQKIQETEIELDKLKGTHNLKVKEIENLRSAEKDAMQYDRSKKEVDAISQKMVKLAKRLGGSTSSNATNSHYRDGISVRTIDSLTAELEEKNEAINKLEKEMEKAQRNKELHYERLHTLQTDLNELESDIVKVQKDQQSRITVEEKIASLKDEINSLQEGVTSIDEQIDSLEPDLRESESDLALATREKRSKESECATKIQKLEKHSNEVKNFDEAIARYREEQISEKLKKVLKEKDILEAQSKELSNEKNELMEHRQSLLKDIATANTKERNLQDNLKLKQYEVSIKERDEELKCENEKLGNTDLSLLRKQKQELVDKITKLRTRKDRLSGSQYPIVDKIRDLETELSKDKYKNAVANYRLRQIEQTAEEFVCTDLDKYYKALDHSVTIYHQKKMEEINKLVFKFWKQAYRGGDIDYIKIAYDNAEEHSATDKRRNFNYRVVMVRKKVEMDMRGRCSAGQKVLASLIIRLALAEIFCINCGILALDEPTTNLDKENIHSLANAIADIVEYHKGFRNFQLIIITHDEEFLKCLDENSNEHYYRVYKDSDGYSKLKRCSIKEQEDRYDSMI